MKRIIFIDKDNKSTILDEDVCGRIREKGQEELKKTFIWVVAGRDFPEKYLHGECDGLLGDNYYPERVSDKSNAADIRIIRRVVELHTKLPNRVSFTIVSGDRAFETIMGECAPRLVIVTSPHTRFNHSIENIIEDMFPPSLDICDTISYMRKIINKLSGLQGLAKLYFVNAGDLARIPEIPDLTQDTHMLLVFSRATKEKCDVENLWFYRFIGDKCYIIDTLTEHKKDAPLFKLLFCVLYLHFMLENSIQFEIISENADDMRDEITDACSGRQVYAKEPKDKNAEFM